MNEEKDSVAELLRIAGPRPKVAGDVKARVFAAVHDEWQNEVKSRRRRRRIFGISGLAAAAAIATILILRPAAPTGTLIETAAETRVLHWGSADLRVERDTRVRLLSDRIAVLEKGGIFVATSQNTVEIRTPLGTVRDIGTQFEVHLDDSNLRVRVHEGRVEVRGTIIDAGAEAVATKSNIETRQFAARVPKLITIEGLTFEEVVARVAREKGLVVEWNNSAAKTKRLHGRTPLSPDEALDAASTAAGAKYTIENGRLVIR